MDEPHNPAFAKYTKGMGKEITDSQSCSEKKNYTLYITGIPPEFSPEGLKNLFSSCGKVQCCNVIPPKHQGWPKVGFIEFGTSPEVVKALEMFKDYRLGNYTLKTSIARKREDRGVKTEGDFPKKIDLTSLVKKSISGNIKKVGKRFENIRDCSGDEKDLEKSIKPCVVCGKMCIATCGQCKRVSYCGSACQKEDWHNHKRVCKPLAMNGTQPVNEGTRSDESRTSDGSDGLMVEVDNDALESFKKAFMSRPELTSLEIPASPARKASQNVSMMPPFVEVGKTVQAVLVDVQMDTGLFYFQLLQNPESKLAQLNHDINAHYGNAKPHNSVEHVDKKKLYACQFSADRRWYRVKVQSVNEDKSACNIWYVDYGNCEDIPTCNLYDLYDAFSASFIHSLRCKLQGCNDINTRETVKVIGEMLKQPTVELYVHSVIDNVASVEMFADINDMKISVNEILMKKFQVEKKIDLPVKTLDNSSKLVASLMEKLKRPEDSVHPTTENVKSVAFFEEVIEKCKIPGKNFTAVISNVVSIEQFSLVASGPDLEALKRLEKDLSLHCRSKRCPATFGEGKLCAARYGDGEEWYRAEMGSQAPDGKISVCFIDYGNVESMELEEICELPKEKKYWVLPRQAILCKLADCILDNKECLEQGTLVLKHCENQNLLVEVKENDEVYEGEPIPVILRIEDAGLSINEMVAQLKAMNDQNSSPEVQETLKTITEELFGNPQEVRLEVLLTHVVSPGDFTCQLVENQAEIANLVIKMTETYMNMQQTDWEISTGGLCAVKYADDSLWYRGKVLNIENDEIVEVLFLDFGNKEKVKKVEVRPLEPKFMEFPVQGLHCSLSDCTPSGGEWGEIGVEVMKNLCNQKFKANIREISPEKIMSLDLQTMNGLSICEELVKCGLAVEISKKEVDEMKEKEEREEEEPLKITEINNNVEKNMLENVENVEIPLEIEKKEQRIHCVEPELKTSQKVGIMYVRNPGEFYCQVLTEENEKFNKFLQENLKADNAEIETSGMPKRGDYCIALSTDNERYRAQVHDVDEKQDEFKVKFIDYGNVELVQRSKIWKMPEKCFEIPALAIRCSLSGCYPKEGGNWPGDCNDILRVFVGQVCDVIFVKSVSDMFHVEIYLNKDMTLNSYMLQRGMAVNEEDFKEMNGKKTEKIEETPDVVEDNKDEEPKETKLQTEEEIEPCREIQEERKPSECVFHEDTVAKIKITKVTSPHDFYGVLDLKSIYLHCKLADIVPIGGSWSEEASDTMQIFSTRPLAVKILQTDANQPAETKIVKIPELINALIVARLGQYSW